MASAPSVASPARAPAPSLASSSPSLQAPGGSSCGQEKQRAAEPELMWLSRLTAADLGLAPIPQDADDGCSIWEGLVSLVDFQSPGFPMSPQEFSSYLHIPRKRAASPAAPASAGPEPPPQAGASPPALPGHGDPESSAHAKPPYSYASLIRMAMEASGEPKLSLAAICKWIRDNFSYYRGAEPSWQTSVRHTLCIDKRFLKVPRQTGEPGRGAFWKLRPAAAERPKRSPWRGRRSPAEQPGPARGPRAPQGAQRARSPAPQPRSAQQKPEASAELQQLLREFEEFASHAGCHPAEPQAAQQWQQWQPTPVAATPVAEDSWLAGQGLGQEAAEPPELTELTLATDWETLLDSCPQPGDFCAPGQPQLSAPGQPEALPPEPSPAPGQPLRWPREQQQSCAQPAADETLMATAFLQSVWPAETPENLCDFIPVPLEAENIQLSLPGHEAPDWDELADLNSLLGTADGGLNFN